MSTQSCDAPNDRRFFDGARRTARPEQTWRRISRCFAATGITRVADVTGLDCVGIPVCNAIRPASRSLSVSQGKGTTLMQARVSAAMEAIELFHAERVAPGPVRASHHRLGPSLAVEPERLALLPGAPRDLGGVALRWNEGVDLLSGRAVLAPHDAVTCDLRIEARCDGVFLTSSNGLGAGNTAVEAMLHGLCEVIERDATCLHDALGAPGAAEAALIDPAEVDDPACQWLFDRIEVAGLAAYAWRLSSDVPVPAFGCAIADGGDSALPGGPLGVFHGYGCHPDRGVALARAIAEAAQSRLTYISGARDDLFRDDYALIQSRRNRMAWLAWLTGARPTLRWDDIASASGVDVAADLGRILAEVERAGFDRVVAVDLSDEAIGIPVFRIIVPGMVEPTVDGKPPRAERIDRFLARRAASARLLRDGLGTGAWV